MPLPKDICRCHGEDGKKKCPQRWNCQRYLALKSEKVLSDTPVAYTLCEFPFSFEMMMPHEPD